MSVFVEGALVKGKEDGEVGGKQIFAPKKQKVQIVVFADQL